MYKRKDLPKAREPLRKQFSAILQLRMVEYGHNLNRELYEVMCKKKSPNINRCQLISYQLMAHYFV